jgi:hypothetical protein
MLIFVSTKQLSNMKAYRINVVDRKVEEIEINDWRGIAPAIGGQCETFEAPVSLENDDTFYVNEEALYQPCEGGWKLENFAYPILGNAVVQGTDEEGESTEPLSTIEEIESMIIWVDKDECEAHRDRTLSRGPRIY